VEQAIHKYRRGYAPEIDEGVTDFWRRYWQLATAEAPELALADPGRKPARAGFVAFRSALAQPDDGPSVTLRHKLPHGRVDLELAGLGARFDELAPRLEGVVPDDATLRRAAKSLAVTVDVSRVDTRRPFSEQREACLAAIHAAARLQAWWQSSADQVADRLR
jgi:hypothetical protein